MRNMLMVAAMAVLMATTLTVSAEPSENCAVRIECESFESLGGWVNDTRFALGTDPVCDGDRPR